MVRKIHAIWLTQWRAQAAAGAGPEILRRQPVHNPDKVGRNEPCLCGSDKKFKQCHGATDRLR